MRYASILAGSVVVAGFVGCFSAEDLPPPPAGMSGSGTGGASGAGGAGGAGGTAMMCNADGIRDMVEECDDGNTMPEDGCSAECKLEACYVWDIPSQSVAFAAAGSSCDSELFCNGAGECVSHCIDKVKDKDEFLLDCGGADCKKCLGESCVSSNECASGNCTNNLCQ